MHALVSEALAMGFNEQHAAAALNRFAREVAAGSTKALSTALHGDAFVEFLFNHPVEELMQTAATAAEQRKQQPNSMKRPAAATCHPVSCHTAADEMGAQEADKENDEDYLADEDVTSVQQPPRKQQPRKRLRRSSEVMTTAATPPPAAAAATPAVATARKVARTKPNSSRDCATQQLHTALQMESEIEDDMSDEFVPLLTAAAAAGHGSSRLQQMQDCCITAMQPSSNRLADTPAVAAAATVAAGDTKGRRTASKIGSSLSRNQAKLDRFFTATQQQQQQQEPHRFATPASAAATVRSRSGNTGFSQTLLSPLNLIKVSSSGDATKTPAAAAASGVKSFLTPSTAPSAAAAAAAAKGCKSSAISAQTTLLSSKSKSRIQQQQQQQQQHIVSNSTAATPPPAAAAATPPWYAPLTESEQSLDLFDLVNLKVFGHQGFRPKQKEIVQQAVAGRDLFVLMPTGGGKSLCYQLPAVISRGVTVVVCPLLSLMQDQVKALCCNPLGGVPATYLSSQQSATEATAVKNELKKGLPTVKLLYVTPEQLVKSDTLRRILQGLAQRGRLARFVIDEAHCVSTWGHDFRPDYKGLSLLRRTFPNTPITAVTATATGRVQSDILSILGVTNTVTVHQTSFLRPNLVFKVVPKVRERDEDADQPLFITKLIQYIKHQLATAAATAAAAAAGVVKPEPGAAAAAAAAAVVEKPCSGIIYCLSRKEAELLAQVLREVGGLKAGHYHAGMTPKQRTEVQNAFFSGQLSVIVATIAFGMGIDKPDVRFVVHFCISKSLEGYYQEAGRAGRDGLPAECVLMYSPADRGRIEYMTRMSLRGSKSSHKLEAALSQLDVMREYAINSDKKCRHAIMLNYFGVQIKDLPSGKCNTSCDVCRGEVVPLNPEEWEDFRDQEAMEADCIDLLESDQDQDDDADDHDEEEAEMQNSDDHDHVVISGSSSGGSGSSDKGSSGSSSSEDEDECSSGSDEEPECSSPGTDSLEQQQWQQQQQRCVEQPGSGAGGFTSARQLQQQQQQQQQQSLQQPAKKAKLPPSLRNLDFVEPGTKRQQQQRHQQQQQQQQNLQHTGLDAIAEQAIDRVAAGVGLGSSSSVGLNRSKKSSSGSSNVFSRIKLPGSQQQQQQQQFTGFVSAAALPRGGVGNQSDAMQQQQKQHHRKSTDMSTAAAAPAGLDGTGWRLKRSSAAAGARNLNSSIRGAHDNSAKAAGPAAAVPAAAAVSRRPAGGHASYDSYNRTSDQSAAVTRDPAAALARELQAADSEDDFM